MTTFMLLNGLCYAKVQGSLNLGLFEDYIQSQLDFESNNKITI